MNLLRKIILEDPSKILIIVTHDPLFQSIADKLLILKDGLITLVIDQNDIEKYSKESLIYKTLNQKLDDTVMKENILKRLEEIKKELLND